MRAAEVRRVLQINSTVLVFLLVVIGLLAGWLIKDWVTSRTEDFNRAGVRASIPYHWSVKYGLAGESLIFSANPPLDRNRKYEVRLLPANPAGKVTDAVNSRNLAQGIALPFYKVSSQQAVRFNSIDGYEVDYTYIKTDIPGQNPAIIQGADIYFWTVSRVILVTFEDTSSKFNETLPEFYSFLGTVSFQTGGQP